ncbi:MAG: hypothetical protein ACI9SP_004031 [Arenicella sp.]|jgi:hypothetical protein
MNRNHLYYLIFFLSVLVCTTAVFAASPVKTIGKAIIGGADDAARLAAQNATRESYERAAQARLKELDQPKVSPKKKSTFEVDQVQPQARADVEAAVSTTPTPELSSAGVNSKLGSKTKGKNNTAAGSSSNTIKTKENLNLYSRDEYISPVHKIDTKPKNIVLNDLAGTRGQLQSLERAMGAPNIARSSKAKSELGAAIHKNTQTANSAEAFNKTKANEAKVVSKNKENANAFAKRKTDNVKALAKNKEKNEIFSKRKAIDSKVTAKNKNNADAIVKRKFSDVKNKVESYPSNPIVRANQTRPDNSLQVSTGTTGTTGSVTTARGNTFPGNSTGSSASGGSPRAARNPKVQEALDNVKNPSRSHGACCEIDAFNKALNAGDSLKGAEMGPVKLNENGRVLGPCSTCREVQKALGVE